MCKVMIPKYIIFSGNSFFKIIRLKIQKFSVTRQKIIFSESLDFTASFDYLLKLS